MGVEGAPPTEEEIQRIRTELANKLTDSGLLADVEQADLDRVNSDDKYVTKFFRHVFDHPGPQTEATVKMIINTLQWRKEMGACTLREEDFPSGMFERGALFSHNRDKDGRKLLVFCVFKHVKGTEKMEDMKKFFVYMLERLYREEKGEQITLLFDCRSAGLRNMDMEFVQFIIGTLKDYYPDPLNYILVLEMPWVLNAAFKVIKGWLPPAAVKKIKFLTKSNMNEYVSDEQRLEEWGGTDTWQYVWQPEETQDSKEDSKKKTVTFAMVQSPSAESVASVGSSVTVNQANNNNTDILLLSPAHEVIFSSSSSGEFSAKIQIQNISSQPVGYKIKTTSPEKYRVKPSTGSLAPNSSATVEIHVSAAQGALTPTSLVRDKFLITAIFLEEGDIKQQQLSEALKSSKPDGQYRLRCQLAPQQLTSDLTAPPTGTNLSPLSELDSNRQMANLLKKVNQVSVKQEELASQVRLCLQILLVLVGLAVIILTVLLFYSSNNAICDGVPGESPLESISVSQTTKSEL